jgi:hypothetical protein
MKLNECELRDNDEGRRDGQNNGKLESIGTKLFVLAALKEH